MKKHRRPQKTTSKQEQKPLRRPRRGSDAATSKKRQQKTTPSQKKKATAVKEKTSHATIRLRRSPTLLQKVSDQRAIPNTSGKAATKTRRFTFLLAAKRFLG